MATLPEFEIQGYHEVFYIQSLLFCTTSALESAAWISGVLQNKASPKFDREEALHHLRNIILQGAAISRYFWPTSKKKPDCKRYNARGTRLREAFSMSDDSPLNFKPPHPRNQMEHFDEYLDDYLQRSIVGQIYPFYFGPAFNIGGAPQHFFQAFFTNTGIYEILGESYKIQPIVDEIGRVYNLLLACPGGRLPRPT